MKSVTLVRSQERLKVLIIASGVAAIVTALVFSWLLSAALSWAPRTEHFLRLVGWLGMGTVWVVQSVLSWMVWRSTTYKITPEAITVQAKSGLLGSAKTMYRYESILSVSVDQSFWGKRRGYGCIKLNVPKLDNDIVLKDVDHPSAQLAELQSRINSRGGSGHALIN